MKELDELIEAATRVVTAADDAIGAPAMMMRWYMDALSQARASLDAAIREYARAVNKPVCSTDYTGLEMKLHEQIRTAFEEAEAQRRATTRRPNMRQAAKVANFGHPTRWYFTSEELARAAAGLTVGDLFPPLKITGRYFIDAVLPELTISELYPWVGERLRVMRDTTRQRLERIEAARELVAKGGVDRWPETPNELRQEIRAAERGEFWAQLDIVVGEEPDPAETGVEFVVR